MYPKKLGISILFSSAILLTIKLGAFPIYVIAPKKTAPIEIAKRVLLKSVINTSQNQSLIHKQSVINSLKNQSLIHFRYSAVPLLVQHQHASTAINGKTAINYLL